RDAGGPERALILENGTDVLEGCMKNCVALIDGTSRMLINVWEKRRRTPGLLPQPERQWPHVAPARTPEFVGFSPGSTWIPGPEARMNPSDVRRWRSAALFDDQRTLWESFD